MLRKTLSVVLAGTVVFSLMLAGCGKTSSQQAAAPTPAKSGETAKSVEKAKITFWDENAGPNRTPFHQEMSKRFQEKNPNIEVEYVGIPNADAKQKIDLAVAANEVPDISGMQAIWLGNYVAKDALTDLGTYLDKWSDKDKIAVSYLDMLRNIVKDKKLYVLPNTANMPIIWYRSDWFKEANITEPKTWDEFFTAVQKLTDKNKNRYGFAIRGGAGGGSWLQQLLFAYSGITDYFDANGKCTVNDPKNLEMLKKIVSLYKVNTAESDLANGYKEMSAAFDSGSVAMMLHNLGSAGDHEKALGKGKYAAMTFPKAVNGKQVINDVNANGYSIFKKSKNQDAAWKYVSYLASADAESYFNQSIGQMPTNVDVQKEQWVKDAQHIQIGSAYLADKNTVIQVLPQHLPDYAPTISTGVVEPGFQAVLAGKKTPESLLNEWADAMTKAKAEYDKNNK